MDCGEDGGGGSEAYGGTKCIVCGVVAVWETVGCEIMMFDGVSTEMRTLTSRRRKRKRGEREENGRV